MGAELNRPITTGDKLWTEANSRAELHVGSASIRLGEQTGFSFLNLDDHMMQVQLTEGTVSVRVRRMAQDEAIEIDTPNLAFSILGPGHYRVSVNEAGDTTMINVRDGEGEVTGGGSSYTVPSDAARDIHGKRHGQCGYRTTAGVGQLRFLVRRAGFA